MENERMKAIKDILKESDRLLDLDDIDGHYENIDGLSTDGHLNYMVDTIAEQQATIDSLSMAHDAIHREMPKDKHTLIKNIIGLNKRVQELEDIIYKDERQAVLEGLYDQNKRYREYFEWIIQNSTDKYAVQASYEALESEE